MSFFERFSELPADTKEWPDEAIVAWVSERYEPTKIPPCRICGDDLGIERIGGGEPTVWRCSGMEDDPDRPGYLRRKKGRKPIDDHYSQSEFIDLRRGGDSIVMELLRRWREKARVTIVLNGRELEVGKRISREEILALAEQPSHATVVCSGRTMVPGDAIDVEEGMAISAVPTDGA